MKQALLCLVILALPVSASPLFNSDCIPEQPPLEPGVPPVEPTTLEWEVGTGGNFPVGGEVVKGSVQGFESDPGPDDAMGAGGVGTFEGTSNPSVELSISNSQGLLSGPNGEIQNGLGEGDCIEVYAEYKVKFKVKVCETVNISFAFEGNGGGFSVENCYYVTRHRLYRTPVKIVCPC